MDTEAKRKQAERWSLEQISQATGLKIPALRRIRRSSGLVRDPRGYTFAQVQIMIGSLAADPEALAGCEDKKVLSLHALLTQDAPPF